MNINKKSFILIIILLFLISYIMGCLKDEIDSDFNIKIFRKYSNPDEENAIKNAEELDIAKILISISLSSLNKIELKPESRIVKPKVKIIGG